MKKAINILSLLASYIYGAGVRLRNFLYDIKVLKSESFDIPIVCVGNITVGGTGKTPTAEMIVGALSSSCRVALLSRGYGRRTKGYREVSASDSYRDTGDEPLQIKMKYPKAVVVVCEKRTEGIRRIRAEHPDVEVIIMDDGFQHRSVRASVNVIVVDATRPVDQDHLLPYGMLRDTLSSLVRAHYFIVAKCPDEMSPLNRSLFRKKLVTAAYQKLYFMRYEYMPLRRLFPEAAGGADIATPAFRSDKVIAMSGIGNPSVFIRELQRRFTVVGELTFDDHHVYRVADLRTMAAMLREHPTAVVVTTEKDAVKLFNSSRIPPAIASRLYYLPVKMNYINDSDKDFLENLERDVRGN